MHIPFHREFLAKLNNESAGLLSQIVEGTHAHLDRKLEAVQVAFCQIQFLQRWIKHISFDMLRNEALPNFLLDHIA